MPHTDHIAGTAHDCPVAISVVHVHAIAPCVYWRGRKACSQRCWRLMQGLMDDFCKLCLQFLGNKPE
jgi:hypothetical protein